MAVRKTPIRKKQIMRQPTTIRAGKVRSIDAEIKERIQLEKTASEIDKSLLTQFSTTQDAINYYNSLPQQLKSKVKNNPKKIQEAQNNRILDLTKKFNRAEEKEEKYDKKGDKEKDSDRKASYKAREKGYRAEANELKKYISKLKNGEIFDVEKIKDYAYEVGRAKRKNKEADYKYDLAKQKAEKEFKTNQDKAKKIFDKASRGETLSVQDFQDIKKAGYKQSDLTKQLRAGNVIKKIETGQSLDPSQYKYLGLPDDVTKKLTGQLTGPLPQKEREQFLNVVQAVKAGKFNKKLRDIDKDPKLNLIQKEEKKRKTLGITDIFGRTAFEKVQKKVITSTLTKNIKKVISQNEFQRLNRKALFGESMTPKQQAKYLAGVRLQGQKLQQAQIDLLIKTIKSPVTYGENLALRYKAGEKNPLWNDVTSFGRGFGRGTKEAIEFPFVAIKAAYDYGRRLVIRAEAGRNPIKDDVIKIAKGITNVTKFVKENPALTGMIVAVAVADGATAIGKKFKKNPAESLGFALTYLIGPEYFAQKGLLIGRKAFAKLSPTVVRGVTILENTAAQRGLGSTLKKLEGKTIDLFHATTTDLKKLFKGTPATKADIDLLIKDMRANPDFYLTPNSKIKPLETIAKSKPKKNIINFLKNRDDVFLSGSGSLSLQTKNFRKIGDLDIVAKDPKKIARMVAKDLNQKSLSGRIFKDRYKVNHNKGAPTYQIWDSLGHKKYNKKYDIADVATWSKLEKDFGKVKLKKIGGVKVFAAEKQLLIKTKLAQMPELGRVEKELKDIKLLIGKEIKQKKFKKIQKTFQEKGLLKVVGIQKGMGTSRRFGWAEQYLGDLNLPFGKNKKLEAKITKRLKKEYGFTDKMIKDNIKLYSPTDMYFAPNQIYTHYLNKDGGNIIMIKNQKISAYPKNIQDKLKKNFAGQLSKAEQAKLGNEMRLYRTKSPNKVFVGQKALQDRVGEFEVLAPEFTKIYAKKTIVSKRVYIPSLDKFIKVQEAVIGTKPTSKLKGLYKKVLNKLKKGYTVKEMKTDVTGWAKKNIKGFKEKAKKVTTKKGRTELKKELKKKKELKSREETFLKSEREKYNKLLNDIDNSKLTSKQKKQLKGSVRERLRKVTKKKIRLVELRPSILLRNKRFNKLKSAVRERIKLRESKIKKIPKGRVTAKAPKRAPKKTPVRAPIKPPVRPPIKPPIRKPIKPPVRDITRAPIKPVDGDDLKLFRFKKLSFNAANKKLTNKVNIYEAKYRARRNERKPYNKKTNPRVTKVLKIRDTKNRALKKVAEKVDRSTARSLQIKIVGTTKSKKKDIKKAAILKKFDEKKTKGSPVLTLVEKARFTIDSPGEVRGLKISKKQKAKTKKKIKKSSKKSTKKSKKKK